MRLKNLIWAFAALFVLFGLLIPLTDNPGWLRWWAGLSTLCLGGFGLTMAGDAVQTRQIRIQFTIIRRADQPRLYWAAVLMVAATGVSVSIVGLWFLFFKDWG